jgi:hypothetical protein
VALAPLLARTEITLFSKALVRAKAPLKPAQSRRFATSSATSLTRPKFFSLRLSFFA